MRKNKGNLILFFCLPGTGNYLRTYVQESHCDRSGSLCWPLDDPGYWRRGFFLLLEVVFTHLARSLG